MRAFVRRHPALRRWPLVAGGVTLGLVLGFVVFGGLTLEARGESAAAAVTECGGVNQRACTFVEFKPACEDNLAEIPGCAGDCLGGDILGVPVFSSGTCVAVTPCGGEGQRACIVGERAGAACDANLTPVPGCSGDCFGKGVGSAWGRSTQTCVSTPIGLMNEPTTNATPAATTCSLTGYADLHLHLFADLAHGSGVLGGQPYDYGTGGGVNQALRHDFTTEKSLEPKSGSGLVGAPALCDQNLFGADCAQTFFHGDHDILAGDSLGAGTKDAAGSNLGAPYFNGWPKWTSTTHQQAYYKWLERAWQGGLRLVTMLAVTNEALCRGSRRAPGVDCEDSMAPIYQQIQAAKDFEAWIAEHHGGWFKIAYTPLEARAAIARGKLAVVLGVETAELFNCKFPRPQCSSYALPGLLIKEVPDDGFLESCTFDAATNDRPLGTDGPAIGECTPASIDAKVQELYDAGVRHVFPVHNFDNAFGGAATWNSTIEIGNRVVEGHWWETRECHPEGYRFKLGGVLDTFSQALVAMLGFGSVTSLPIKLEQASCNEFGLLPLGRALMQSLMKRGMIIDVDHLSSRAFDDTMDMALNPGTWVPGRSLPYPVVATHVLLRETHFSDSETLHERMRTRAQLLKIQQSGGMIAAMLKDDVQDTDRKGQRTTRTGTLPGLVPPFISDFVDNCRHSSKSFAVAYANLAWTMLNPVALGSDFNGTAGHFGPRFGSSACGGPPEAGTDAGAEPFPADVAARQWERSVQYRFSGRVTYPFTLPGFGTFQAQRTGFKTFNYNVDGLAHIGLLPDFVQDLKVMGFAQKLGPAGTYLDMLFRSAEEYVKVWERARVEPPPADICALISSDSEPPAVTPTVTPAPNAAGWHKAAPTVSWTVTDDSGSASTTGCGAVTVTAETSGTVFTCTATDAAGNSAQASVTIKLDMTPPTISGTPSPAANAHGWNSTSVTVGFTCADDRSGIGACPPAAVIGTEGAGQSLSRAASDVAGNVATAFVSGINIDKTPPTLTGMTSPAANANGWNNTDVTVGFTCEDGLSGVNSCPAASVVGTEGAGQTRSGFATDLAGNATFAEVTGINLDKTLPVITTARAPEAGPFGWNNTDVTVTFTCSDDRSGVANCSPPSTVTAEGAAQARTGQVTDRAGNMATVVEDGISIDKTPPIVTAGRAPLANAYGWNNTAVTAEFSATDALSGIDGDAAVDDVAAAEGADQARTHVFTDLAGNSAVATVAGISIDLTPPVITAAADRAPNANGWYGADVTVSYTCDDALAGVLSCSPAETLSVEGASLSSTGVAVDLAGNTAQASLAGINIDWTPPVVTCTNDSPSIWPPNGQLVTVRTTVGIEGGLSGAAGFTLVTTASSEPDTDLGDGDTANDMQGWLLGTPDTEGQLRAERSGRGPGRVYALVYEGTDFAGNAAVCTTTAVVPHDQ